MMAKLGIYPASTSMYFMRSLPCRYGSLICQSIVEFAINDYSNDNDFKLYEFAKGFATVKKAR